jgi:hypothetical protein
MWNKAEAKVVLGTNTLAYLTGMSLRKKRFYEKDIKKMKWSRKQKLVKDKHSSLFDESVIKEEKGFMRWICEKMKRSRKQKLVSDQHSSFFDESVIEKEKVLWDGYQDSEKKQKAKVVLGTNTLAYLTRVSLRKKRFYEMDSEKVKWRRKQKLY